MLARFHALRQTERDLSVQEVMTCGVVTVESDTPLTRVAALMYDRRIDRAAVVERTRLVGIVTDRENVVVLATFPVVLAPAASQERLGCAERRRLGNWKDGAPAADRR